METVSPTTMSVILGGLAPFVIHALIDIFKITERQEKLKVTYLVCLIYGILLSISTNAIPASLKLQNLVKYSFIILGLSQTIYNLVKKEMKKNFPPINDTTETTTIDFHT